MVPERTGRRLGSIANARVSGGRLSNVNISDTELNAIKKENAQGKDAIFALEAQTNSAVPWYIITPRACYRCVRTQRRAVPSGRAPPLAMALGISSQPSRDRVRLAMLQSTLSP
jgi:hypothetical protein